MVACILLPQPLSRCTFWYSFFHSQHNYWVLIPENSLDLGHYIFSPLARRGVLTFYGVSYGPRRAGVVPVKACTRDIPWSHRAVNKATQHNAMQ